MIIPAALPDELDRGYLGVQLRINGYTKETEFVKALATYLDVGSGGRFEVPTLELLAKAAGQEQTAFARSHTTLPFRRGITAYKDELIHGDPSAKAMMRLAGLRSVRPGAYFCEDCVAADQDFHGRSYWRRQFQLPGLYWCPKHRIPLLYTEDQDAFLKSPSVIHPEAVKFTAEECDQLRATREIQTFLDLSSVLMDSERPIPVARMLPVMRKRAQERGFLVKSKKGPGARSGEQWLSDEVHRRFPTDWLCEVYPQFQAKLPGQTLKTLDAVLWSPTAASSVTAYLLAASILFDGADEVMEHVQEVVSTTKQDHGRPTKYQSIRSMSTRDDELLSNLYVKNLGVHAETWKAYGQGQHVATTRLRQIGLPSLFVRRTRRSVVTALEAYFLRGLNLEQSAQFGGVDQMDLETVLRSSAPQLVKALEQMQAARTSLSGDPNAAAPRARRRSRRQGVRRPFAAAQVESESSTQ